MIIASNWFKQLTNSDHKIAEILVTGFTSMLKGWWENYLQEIDCQYIFCAQKEIMQNNTLILIEDIVPTLIFAITKQFVGDLIPFKQKKKRKNSSKS